MILKIILILIQLSITTIYGYLVYKLWKYKKDDIWWLCMGASLMSLSLALQTVSDPIRISNIILTIVLAIGLLLYAPDVIRLR